MSKDLLIGKNAKNATPISKEQRRYNSLIAKIEKLQNTIELFKDLDAELRREGTVMVLPVEKAVADAQKEFILAFERSPFKDTLKSKKKQKFVDILLEELDDVLGYEFFAEDAELIALYDKYNEGTTYAEEKAQNDARAKSMAAKMFNEMFDADLNEEDLDDLEKMMEKMHAKQAEMEAEAEQEKARKAARKKTPKQIAAEAKREAAQSTIKKSAKQMYHDLVKHFHPDKESDEVKKAEKTEIMKQITAAYEAEDHLKLVRLQMSLLSDRENVFASFDDQQLRYFNEALEGQLNDLDEELEKNHPINNGNIYATLFSSNRKVMYANIEKHIKGLKGNIKIMQNRKEYIRDSRGFKDFVNEYELMEDDIDFDFYEMVRMAADIK